MTIYNRHNETQEDYRRMGYKLEERLTLPDGSYCIVDCYNPLNGCIVEIVDTHGDLEKAKLFKDLGLKVRWHFVSDVVKMSKYKQYGEVVRDYYDDCFDDYL